MAQNRSTAVMQRRHEAPDALDDYPTPPWATRALCEFLRETLALPIDAMTCREPAANRGYMFRTLAESFGYVEGFDVHDYGVGFPVADYLFPTPLDPVDWTVTNPPFRLARQFLDRMAATSRVGYAVLVRSAFLEGQERFADLFGPTPPAYALQFVERCLMVRSRLIKEGAPDPFNLKDDGTPVKARTATAYCWLVWIHGNQDTRLRWLDNCRTRLERPGDYPDYAERWAEISPKGGLL